MGERQKEQFSEKQVGRRDNRFGQLSNLSLCLLHNNKRHCNLQQNRGGHSRMEESYARAEEKGQRAGRRGAKREILVLSPALLYIPHMLINPMTMIPGSQVGDRRQILGHPIPIQTSPKQK